MSSSIAHAAASAAAFFCFPEGKLCIARRLLHHLLHKVLRVHGRLDRVGVFFFAMNHFLVLRWGSLLQGIGKSILKI